MKKKDWDYIAKLERAISERYGPETILNPRRNWDDEKEEEYLIQIKHLDKKELKSKEQSEKVEINGVRVSKKVLNRTTEKTCPVCSVYSMKPRDDVYMAKYECCHLCYIEWVEGREERWTTGWRPARDK